MGNKKPIYTSRYFGRFFNVYSWFVIFSFLFNIGYFLINSYLDKSFFQIENFILFVGPSFLIALCYYLFRTYVNKEEHFLDLKKWQKNCINIIYIVSIYSFIFLYKHLFILYSLPIFLVLASCIDLDKEKVKNTTFSFIFINLIIELALLLIFNYDKTSLIDFLLSSFVLFLMNKFANILIDYMEELLGEVDKVLNRQRILNDNFYKAVGDLKIEPMTGLFNKRALNETLDAKISAFNRNGKMAYVCILDLDYFKKVNDTYGHDVGDKVLISLADTLKQKVKGKGSAYRFGGEEFVLIFEKYTKEEVYNIVEDIRVSFGKIKFSQMNGKQLTLSAGISGIKQGDTPDTFLKRADDALYYSKENGRNQVTLAK